MTTIADASRQWATRPSDERFGTLDALRTHLTTRHTLSREVTVSDASLTVGHTDDNEVVVQIGQGDSAIMAYPNHRAFGQLCQRVGAPASYLRSLPAQLAAINLAYGIEQPLGGSIRERAKLLVTLGRSEPGDDGESAKRYTMRALTSPSYGRIWDDQQVEAVDYINGDGLWQVPSSTRWVKDSKRATTLYAGDTSTFIFLVDPSRPIEAGKTPSGDPDIFFRGFIMSNSETGDAAFRLKTFLYRYVCDNRIIWGAERMQELVLRHTSGGPRRFAQEARPHLARFAGMADAETVRGITVAKAAQIPTEGRSSREIARTASEWLQARKFTKTQSEKAVEYAVREEGAPDTVWNLVQGLTAYARDEIANTDDRMDLEIAAGRLLAAVR